MLRRVVLPFAILSSLSVAGCHNAGIDTSSSEKEQPAVARIADKSAQNPPSTSGSDPAKAVAAAPASSAKLPTPFRGDEAWVLVEDENIFIPVLDDLGQNLLVADAAIRAEKNQDAATYLRNAATYLATLEVLPDSKAKLTSAADELNSLAQDLLHGQVGSKRLARVYQQAFDADLAGQWVVTEIEDSWQPYSRRPGQHLDRAYRELKLDPRAAAIDIREANSYLRVEALRHQNDLLDSVIKELADLADQIDRGKVKDPSRIEDAIEDSGHALASTHYHVAVDAWERHDHAMASRQLKESVAHLKHAASRTEKQTKAAVEALGRDANILLNDTKADMIAFSKRVDVVLRQFKADLDKRHPKPQQGG